MATGSVALIYTNAMGDMTTTGTTWDNLKLSFAGATEMPRNIIAHELHELTRRQCAKKNGDRVGRTNLHECKEFFIYMSCGVVPSRHIVLTSPIRALRTRLPSLRSVVPSRHVVLVVLIRGLRPRLPSLRSVLPSRQIALNEIFLPTNCTNGHE